MEIIKMYIIGAMQYLTLIVHINLKLKNTFTDLKFKLMLRRQKAFQSYLNTHWNDESCYASEHRRCL